MQFIDLFSGLGGFHVAMNRLGHNCVFASELDTELRELYKKNFDIFPAGDIREVHPEDIPSHDILCAGFPCQPFSKAGSQEGLDCPRQGDLFWHVEKILSYHKPKFFILENVPNLIYHAGGKTFDLMKRKLEKLQYEVSEKRLSPHHFGIPQKRERIYIVGSLKGLKGFDWPEKQKHSLSIHQSLDKNPVDATRLPEKLIDCLNSWNIFLKKFPKRDSLPGFPIWSMEFGATYPFEDTTPFAMGAKKLAAYKGCHGERLSKCAQTDVFEFLPSYARTEEIEFPEWKKDFIRKNRELYKANKKWIDKWIPKINYFPPSYQKLEWNCGGEERDIWKYILQFRASGVRVKRPNTAPSLVAMTITQVPILGWEKRYLTPRECAKLQCLESLQHLPKSPTKSFKAFGNAVNSRVVEMILNSLLPKFNSNGAHAQSTSQFLLEKIA